MAITSVLSVDGNELTIGVEGRFDFSSHQDFRRAYEGQPTQSTGYVIDLQNTTYLDSSALGMLLLLKDYAGGDNANIQIINCNDDVRKILAISNFEQLFSIG
ncbi:MAG: anti-anti-sigma factor [Pseudohongiellaceae bacterium]|jgi:anti-anti-sigma factor